MFLRNEKTKESISGTTARLTKLESSKGISKSLAPDVVVQDTFKGIRLSWVLTKSARPCGKQNEEDSYYFTVRFENKHRLKVESLYIDYIREMAEAVKSANRQKRLYSNSDSSDRRFSPWTSVPFAHPSNFESLALDPCIKSEIKEDLKAFLRRKAYYNKVGRAWKRGYLLYGPPGTGKTSLIAAMANFLDFDVYDLELTAVKDNNHLRRLLFTISCKSVIVVEDIDCSVNLTDRKGEASKKLNTSMKSVNKNGSAVSLSGVLNFVDGPSSTCGGERIIIFTTNHKDHLDPALIRPGRMDKHIHLSYCGNGAFRILAKNYLDVENHPLIDQICGLLSTVHITPAEIAEKLMEFEDDADSALRGVLKEVKKRLQKSEAVAKGEDEQGEELHMEQIPDQRATKYSNWMNALLFVFQTLAMVESYSLAITASALLSFGDLMAGSVLGWFTNLSVQSSVKNCAGKIRARQVGIITYVAVMATLGCQGLILDSKQLHIGVLFKNLTSKKCTCPCSIMLASIAMQLVFYTYCRYYGNSHQIGEGHSFDAVSNVVGLVACLLSEKFCWWIDLSGAVILIIYAVSKWYRITLKCRVEERPRKENS